MNNQVTSARLATPSGGRARQPCSLRRESHGPTQDRSYPNALANEAAEEHRSVSLRPPVVATLSPWRPPAADTCRSEPCRPDTCRSEPCRPELPAAAAPCAAARRPGGGR